MAGGERAASILQLLLPTLPILVPLAVHFVLVNFALLTNLGLFPFAYVFSHFFFFIVGLWTAQDEKSVLAVIVFIVVVVVTILLDIIQLGLYFEDGQDAYGDGNTKDQRTWQFSAGMAILNLLGKPVTIALACVAAYFRFGGRIPGLGGGGGGGGEGGSDSYASVHGSSGGE